MVFRRQLNALLRHGCLVGTEVSSTSALSVQRFRLRSQHEEDASRWLFCVPQVFATVRLLRLTAERPVATRRYGPTSLVGAVSWSMGTGRRSLAPEIPLLTAAQAFRAQLVSYDPAGESRNETDIYAAATSAGLPLVDV